MSNNNNQYLNDFQRSMLQNAIKNYKGDYEGLREIIDDAGITQNTLVKPADFPLVQRVIALCYNPLDKGANGKMQEVALRCEHYAEINRALRWSEFFARSPKHIDNCAHGYRFEDKSGAGDWLRSKTARTREEAIKEYRGHREWIRWIVPEWGICYVCSWSKLFDILDTYNEKGCAQFFKAKVKFTQKGIIVQLQTFTNSKKKLAWLAAHSIDMRNE